MFTNSGLLPYDYVTFARTIYIGGSINSPRAECPGGRPCCRVAAMSASSSIPNNTPFFIFDAFRSDTQFFMTRPTALRGMARFFRYVTGTRSFHPRSEAVRVCRITTPSWGDLRMLLPSPIRLPNCRTLPPQLTSRNPTTVESSRNRLQAAGKNPSPKES